MRLRHAADWRTLVWAFVLTPLVLGLQFARPDLVPYLCWVSAYLALSCGVIAHNHNHCSTFKNKRSNYAFSSWISIFYGYPTFAWIPTHNLNHHKLVNAPGDATITWRYTNKNNIWVAATYFFVSSYFQSEPIKNYIREAKKNNRKLYRSIIAQYAIWIAGHIILLSLACGLHGVSTGLYLWGLTCLMPALFALWAIMLFNYIQHVHADPWSKYDHSRTFDGRLANFLLFNNGLHTAHHEISGLHWSQLREKHESIAHKIDPRLVESSLAAYLVRQYLLTPFFPRLGSQQVGRAPFSAPDEPSLYQTAHMQP